MSCPLQAWCIDVCDRYPLLSGCRGKQVVINFQEPRSVVRDSTDLVKLRLFCVYYSVDVVLMKMIITVNILILIISRHPKKVRGYILGPQLFTQVVLRDKA